MHAPGDDNEAGCGGGCQNCHLDQTPPDAPRGARLVAMSAVFFLLPLILAIVGAGVVPLLWRHDAAQVVGGVAGLGVGLAIAAVAGRLWNASPGGTPA